MKLLINKERFIEWYFDHEIQTNFFHRHGILDKLKEKGVFTINLQDVLDNVGYLPLYVVEDEQDVESNILEEVEMSEYDEIKFA